jgi:3-keto-5-aminohexanoate cleavage enzyme
MQPLIIIATPNICWLNPDVEYPRTPEAIAEEGRRCYENGATILHTHAEGRWKETIAAVRARSEIIVQCGMSSLPIPERMDVFTHKADMISIILNHHDEAFVKADFNVLHLKEELIEYTRLCREYGVIPEWEVWHAGSIWNLNFLIGRKLLQLPYVTTLFFGWPGGTWSPPTVEEYLYRRRLMPEGCACMSASWARGSATSLPQRSSTATTYASGPRTCLMTTAANWWTRLRLCMKPLRWRAPSTVRWRRFPRRGR